MFVDDMMKVHVIREAKEAVLFSVQDFRRSNLQFIDS